MKEVKLPDFYLGQSIITDPGEYAGMLEVFRDYGIPEIVEAIQGLFLHIFWAERYGVKLTQEQKQHVQSRKITNILRKVTEMDGSPLNLARPYEKRFIGNCRDFSVLLCSILRSKGTPARARCGFGTYFMPGHYEDHWMCEYWDSKENRWIRVDPQIDRLQREVLKISFDLLDMPEGQFVTGCEAWKLCRSGNANPDDFGIFDMHGIGFVRGDLIRDIAAYNKTELLPWDCWGLMDKDEKQLTEQDHALMDRAAELILAQNNEIYALYESNAGLSGTGTIRNYTADGVREITLK